MGSQTKYFLWIDLLWSFFCCVESAYFGCFLTYMKSKKRSPKQTWRHHPPERPHTDFRRHRQGWELEAMAFWEWNLRGLRAPRCCLGFTPWVGRSGCFTQSNDPAAAAGFFPLWEAVSSSYWRALAVLRNLCFGADNHRLAEHRWKVVDPDLVHPFALKAVSATQPFID